MKPKEFPEVNKTFVAEGCGDLPAFQDEKQIVSCWEFEGMEKLLVLFHGKIWLSVLMPQQPPVGLPASNPLLDENGNAENIGEVIDKFLDRKIQQWLAPQELPEAQAEFAASMLKAFMLFTFVATEVEGENV